MKESTKNIIKYFLAAAITIAAIYVVIKDIDFPILWEILLNVNYFYILLTIPIILFSHVIRALRWKTLLAPVHKAKSLFNLFSGVMVGYAVNAFTPRGGELVRPFVYARREKISLTSTFATIIVERVIDVLTLLFIFAGAFFWYREEIAAAFPYMTPDKIVLYFIAPVLAILALLILIIYTNIGYLLLQKLIKPFSEKFYIKLETLMVKFIRGFAFIKTPSQYFRVIMESFLMWFFYALPLYVTFFAFNFQSVLHLTMGDAVLLLIVVGIGVTIAPTPGSIGVYHWLVTLAMTNLYDITKEDAFAFATVAHAVNYIVQIAFGAAFLLRENIRGIPHKEDIEEKIDQSELTTR